MVGDFKGWAGWLDGWAGDLEGKAWAAQTQRGVLGMSSMGEAPIDERCESGAWARLGEGVSHPFPQAALPRRLGWENPKETLLRFSSGCLNEGSSIPASGAG